MGLSFDPFVELQVTMADLNMRHQQQEDYFLALLGAGTATQQAIEGEAGEGLGDRAPAYLDLSDNMIYQMDNDASGPRAGTIRGFIDGAVLTGETARLVIGGLLDGFTSLSDFDPVYVGSTAGSVTQTRPSTTIEGSQVMIAEMGFAVNDETVFVRPRPIQYQKRAALADNETITISHHPDAEGYLRKLAAYYMEVEAGSSLVTYASANQDSNVSLENNSPVTYTADQCSGGTASASTAFAGTPASDAFANNGNAAADSWAANSVTTGWLKYDFGVGVTKTIKRYTIHETTSEADRAPKTWTFEGSNDDTNWTVLDTQTNFTSWAGATVNFNVVNSTAYRYYRINVSANNGDSTFLSIGEMEMMEGATYAEYDKLAQTFNLGSTQTVGAVTLWVKKVGSPTGTVTVRIETISGGNPTGTLAHANATATFNEADLSTSYAAKVVTFASSFSLNSADYAIVVSTSRSASETDYIDWGADGSAPSFASGEMKTYSGSWSAASKDAVFTLSAPGTSHPQAVAVDWWTSTHADLVNRYGDGSGADLSTKTTFKNLRDAGFDDMVLSVEVA